MALDYESIAKGRLPNQFIEKPLIRALTGAMVAPLTLVEQLADELRSERWIATAVGVQLDGAGYIVGEPRMGRMDEEYREAILFRIFINTSQATPEDLIKALRFLTHPDDIQYIEQYPATAIMFTDGPDIPSNIQEVIQGLSPAAISDVPVLVTYSHVPPFRFGMSAPPGELFVNSDTAYLQANSSDIQVQGQPSATGADLAGVSPGELTAGGMYIDVGGAYLAINTQNFNVIIESGTHLTGIFS